MVLNNTLSTRRFKMKPLPNGSWDDIAPNFGMIKGLHLEYLEFGHKIKKNAPIIQEPTYSGKAFDEPKTSQKPPPPASDTGVPSKEPEKESKKSKSSSHSSETLRSEDDYSYSDESKDESKDEENSKDKNFLAKFGATPVASRSQTSSHVTPMATPKRSKEERSSRKEEKERRSSRKDEKIPKYINVEEAKTDTVHAQIIEEEKEEDPQETYIREEVERRMNIAALKKAKAAGIEIGDNIDDDMDLQTTRIIRKTTDAQVSHNKSVSMNRFALMGIFLGVDQGFNFITDKMKGYFQYQMDIMHIYDEYLEAIGENSINTYLQSLDPSIQLIGMIGLTTGGFYIFQNFVGEDKVKGAKLIASFFPGQAKVIDEITNASKKAKEDKKQDKEEQSGNEKPKKRRGPSYRPEDINVAE